MGESTAQRVDVTEQFAAYAVKFIPEDERQ
jgi:hypothetical protein